MKYSHKSVTQENGIWSWFYFLLGLPSLTKPDCISSKGITTSTFLSFVGTRHHQMYLCAIETVLVM